MKSVATDASIWSNVAVNVGLEVVPPFTVDLPISCGPKLEKIWTQLR